MEFRPFVQNAHATKWLITGPQQFMGVRPPTKFGPDSGGKFFGVVHLKLAYHIITCILETTMKHKSFTPLTKIVSCNNGKR